MLRLGIVHAQQTGADQQVQPDCEPDRITFQVRRPAHRAGFLQQGSHNDTPVLGGAYRSIGSIDGVAITRPSADLPGPPSAREARCCAQATAADPSIWT